ncbi:LysM peptidoglycan-binding domain-containing protein [Barrientosiimonas endolithica]|uniref:LysM domain-containing protein n=1 Tax=Barrientosiimonas endolithica TaxID=1535208 RepID=A0ABM8HD04_9MICO|nr:hypothetical protein [Barrientosiimonas endolithica]BDZ58844.1 hypothetical protein GCM10025872_25010 [Barrientosiimonas endolithica]
MQPGAGPGGAPQPPGRGRPPHAAALPRAGHPHHRPAARRDGVRLARRHDHRDGGERAHRDDQRGQRRSSPDLLAPRSAPAPDFAEGEAGERSQPFPDLAPRDERPAGSRSAPSPDLAPGDQRPADPTTARGCAPPTAPEPGWVGSGPRLQPSSTLDRAGLLGRCAPASGEIVVHRGDTLWSIVERDLGPTATAREIAEAWPRWFAANREAIGADPDLLLPGTVLLRPSQEAVS